MLKNQFQPRAVIRQVVIPAKLVYWQATECDVILRITHSYELLCATFREESVRGDVYIHWCVL